MAEKHRMEPQPQRVGNVWTWSPPNAVFNQRLNIATPCYRWVDGTSPTDGGAAGIVAQCPFIGLNIQVVRDGDEWAWSV